MDIKMFIATKAFIVHNDKILILRESSKYEDGVNASRYDVVGGRITPGERFDDALKREVLEETGLNIEIGAPFFVNEWRPVVRGEQWQIVAVFFDCSSKSTEVKLSSDHDEYKWIDPTQYLSHNLIENLYPAFEAYLKYKQSSSH